MVFVFDEDPYLAKAEKSISSRLQHIIDHAWQEGQLYLILCGSSMSFMEYQVLGYESPLYGRRTAQIKVQALTYRETALFHPELSRQDQALLYGITGGIPHYINKLEVENDLDEAILENLFNTSSYLFEETENLLKQELRETAIYNSIISVVAGGASRSNEISTKAGLESGVCAKYLRVLLDLGILKKETPVMEKSGRKTIYLIGSCKYRNEKIGTEELELLRRYAAVFRRDGRFRYYIFSKGGFTTALLEMEKQGEVTLLTLEDIYKNI